MLATGFATASETKSLKQLLGAVALFLTQRAFIGLLRFELYEVKGQLLTVSLNLGLHVTR